jgi:hypothetical protein
MTSPDYVDSSGEPVKPLSAFYSTSLNPRVTSYDQLATRIAYSLGYPSTNVEAHVNAVYDNISIACEMFAKFAGYTEEYLVFDSDLYEPGKGIQLDKLFSITPDLAKCYDTSSKELKDSCDESDPVSGTETTGTTATTATTGTETTGTTATTATTGTETTGITATTASKAPDPSSCHFNTGYDYDLNDYRKVIDVWSFEQGTHTGVNTLFTLEQSLAQQTYFSYAMGNYGFDLVSWYAVKEWLELREKLLVTKPSLLFNDRTQYLKLVPEPRNRYYGIVACYVERPVKDLVRELWVYKYSLALTKLVVGRVRTKYSNVTLLGGGNINGDDLLAEGKEEKEALEQQLYEGAPGLGDAGPPMFFVA